MRVVLTDGTEIRCRNFKAIDAGVLLTEDKKRKRVVGFVPAHQLRYVLPEGHDVVTPVSTTETEPTADEDAGATDARSEPTSDREHEADGPTVRRDVEPASIEPHDGSSDQPEAGTRSDIRRLGGLGATYADRLASAGYRTLENLAGADPVAVAEAAAVAPGRARRWVEAATRITASSADPPTADEPTAADAEGADAETGSDDETTADSDTAEHEEAAERRADDE